MTLHLSQIFLTDALTFINQFSVLSCQFSVLSDCNCRSLASLGMTKPKRKRIKNLNQNLFIAVHNPPAIQIVRRKFDRDFVSRQYPYKVLPHLAGNVRQYLVFVFKLHLEHGIGQRFDDRCHHFNRVLFTHYPPEFLLTTDPSLRSGSRQRAPASLTPARRLNFIRVFFTHYPPKNQFSVLGSRFSVTSS